MIYLFNHKEELLGELKTAELGSCIQEETLNGLERLDFEVLLPYKYKMKGVEFVVHADVNEPKDFYMYKIISAANTRNSYAYTCINVAYDDLKSYGYLREYRMQKTTGRLALETVLHGSRWAVGTVEDTAQRDFYIYDLTRLDAIGKLIETFNVELEFKVNFNGNKITSRVVNLYQKRGYVTGKRFYYGSNALEVVKEETTGDIYTAVIGRGKGEEKVNADGDTTGGYGRRIDFKDIEWRKDKGDPLDKPKGQEFIELPQATELYGYSDGTSRYKIIVHDQIEDPAELLQACYDDLIKGSRPLVEFKASIKDYGRVFLGDTVNIIRKDLDIYYTARVFKITRDLLNIYNTKIELGDNLDYGQGKKNKELANNLKSVDNRISNVVESVNLTFTKVIEEMREGLTNSFFNEDGYNYEFKAGNKYGIPAGYYSFDKPIDQNPTKVIYIGAGKMAIANQKDSEGKWDFKTFGTGDGLLAEAIIGNLGEFAKVNANQINVNNDFAESQLGKKVVIQDKLYNNVKITPEKGLQVLDDKSRERVQLGNWASGRYGLKVTDESGNKTVLDDNGMLQTWQDGRCDNADSGHPLKIPIFIPKETAKIYKAYLRIYIESFRAYSKALTTVEAKYSTTNGGGFQSAFGTTDGGGGIYYTTHGSKDVDGRNVQRVVTDFSGKQIGFAEDYHVYSHEHDISIEPHSHNVSVRVDGHSHDFTIPAHGHDIVYGIYEENNSDSNMEIFINGNDRTSALTGSGYFKNTQSELDITNYLNKGSWNIVEIKTRERMRIDATVFIQALLNYGGY